MVGVATKKAPLRVRGYKALLGSSDESWAWNLVDNYLLHGGSRLDQYPKCNNPAKYQVEIFLQLPRPHVQFKLVNSPRTICITIKFLMT